MTTSYGVVLRAEFVRAGAATGAKGNPLRPLYFKALPKGKADVPAILLGVPCLGFSSSWFGLAADRRVTLFQRVVSPHA